MMQCSHDNEKLTRHVNMTDTTKNTTAFKNLDETVTYIQGQVKELAKRESSQSTHVQGIARQSKNAPANAHDGACQHHPECCQDSWAHRRDCSCKFNIPTTIPWGKIIRTPNLINTLSTLHFISPSNTCR